jgi:solute carrier family 25 phosphate transporter 3
MLGGVLACGFTHAGVTPLDVAKCNMQVHFRAILYFLCSLGRQVDPKKYTGLRSSLGLLVKEEGMTGIWKGVGPTFVGYSLQGLFKYGLYEIFKDMYSNVAGEEASQKYRSAIWLAGSASAEFFADIALCPLEMTKVKIQTSPSGTFPTAFGAAIREMRVRKAETRYPFGSIVPLWSRQVRPSVSHTSIVANGGIRTDPIYHGQVLFLRKDRIAFLYPRLHRGEIELCQDHATWHHIHVWLPGWRHLRYRLAPG